jgi:glycosyltransferase involved in cell wall biosynthesis
MRVMFFGTYDVQRHPRVAVLREGLQTSGIQVDECNSPLGLSTAQRVKLLKKPWLVPAQALRLFARWFQLWRCARSRTEADLIVVGYMGHFDIHLAHWLFRRQRIALDFLISGRGTALDRGSDRKILLSILGILDRSALRSCDIALVDTEEHLWDLPTEARPKGVVVEVGAQGAWFEAGKKRIAEGRVLKVIFFGLYTPLQGAVSIGEAIHLIADRSQIHFTMIGTGQDRELAMEAAGGSSNVDWLNWVDADELPSLVAAHHVCLGIFGTGAKARKVVPNKVYQGAAAGCAVVTSDTPPQHRILGEAALLIPAGDGSALADALLALAEQPELLVEKRRAAADLAERLFRPDRIVQPLLDVASEDDAR